MSAGRRARSILSRVLRPLARRTWMLGAAIALVTLGMALECYVGISEVLGASGLVIIFALAVAFGLLCTSSPATAKQSSAVEGDPSAARVDATTGLPNRQTLVERLGQELLGAQRRGALAAVCILDLDGLKRARDGFGAGAGDRFLVDVAARMMSTLRQSDSLARPGADERCGEVSRLGGAEFVVLLKDIAEAQDAARGVRRILATLRDPWQVDGASVQPSASAGIAVYPFDGEAVATLLEKADTAMCQAKHMGRNRYRFASHSMNETAQRRLEVEGRLRWALERGQLAVHYQAQRDATSGEVVAAEALLRWEDPKLGCPSPGEFVPVAEETGLIVPIGEWVLRRACAQAQAWKDAGMRPIRICVNVSGVQLLQPDFAKRVESALRDSGLGADWLELELTEGSILRSNAVSDTVLLELDALGVGLVLDDFGTEYASLSSLKRFPIRRLKIDDSLVAGIPENLEHGVLTSAIVSVARRLGMRVVAEGVETLEQVEALRELGCDELQGYLFGRAAPADEFVRCLARGKGLRPASA